MNLTLDLKIELEICHLNVSQGAVTAFDFGSAAASVELKYKDQVLVPKCWTPGITLGSKTLAEPWVVP